MARNNVPILFLVFNRPVQTKASLERIREAQPSVLYVHCDGPRAHKAGENILVSQVRMLIQTEIDWNCKVVTLYRENNLGLREGVFDAINWFFKQEPEGIILEDDCVPDLTFFRFCEELLERYRNDEQVMHIGGSNLAEKYTSTKTESYVFSRFSFVWGWATWRRAWEKMTLNLEGLDDFEKRSAFKQFMSNSFARSYMLDKFRHTQQRKNNSWAYAWFYSILKNKGLCIVPIKNLIQNVGVGEPSATNTTTSNKDAMLRASRLDWPLLHPVDRTPDPALEQHFFYTSQKKRHRLLIWWALKQMKLR